MNKTEFPSYKSLQRKIDAGIVLTTLSGAVTSMLYLSVLEPMATGQETASRPLEMATVVVFVLFMIFAFWLGDRISHDRSIPVSDWYERLRSGQPNSSPPMAVRRYIFFWPMRQLLGTAVMWVIAGLFFGMLAAVGASLGDGLHNFVAITIVGGVISCTLLYFLIDWLWRPVIALFSQGIDPRDITVFHLPVMGRLLIAFLLVGGMTPALLTVVTSRRLSWLLESPNPEILLENLQLVQIFILTTSFLAGIGIAIFMARGIVGPLESLQKGMARIENNDFNVTIPITSNDELGYLSYRFNQMTNGLRQGELMRNLLNLYVSPEVARNALENGAQLGGQLVTCTVLFADIRDFTTISEQLTPEMLMKLLNQYMSDMVEVIVQNGGMVNKFGGDSLLAVFGTPLNPQPNHARQAVTAAQAMFAALDAFNLSQAQANQPQLRIGIGIATGPVVAGNVGGQERLEYTVIGDTVNLASRLQDKTKDVPGDLLVSEATFQSIEDSLDLAAEKLTAVAIKGKQRAVSVYAILAQPA